MELLTTPPCDPFCKGEHPVVVMRLYNFNARIRIQLEPAAAPITVAYFLQLVQEGFYNGLKFHRLVPGFILQGGCPLGTGDGETDYYLKGEFAENGVDNPIMHTRGVLSMARQEGCDTASCQFFIILGNAPSLDGHYAAFGQVVEGMEVIDRLSRMGTDRAEHPRAPIVITRMYVE
ncbi:MAG: peptidylprolyl isomerase [Coriobacteriia bacterium]|nr:peptidylprolyl isomerase [Coriobacteriia bacterium]